MRVCLAQFGDCYEKKAKGFFFAPFLVGSFGAVTV